MTLQRHTTSNQPWNVVYVDVGICNVDKHRINVVYYNVGLNNVRHRRNSTVILNVDLHNVEHVETTLWIWPLKNWKNKVWVKNIIILFSSNKIHLNWKCWTQNLIHFAPFLRVEKWLQGRKKILKLFHAISWKQYLN